MTVILKAPEVERRTGRSRVWLWRHARDGSFPKPVQLSSRTIGWVESQVEEWLSNLPTGNNYQQAAPLSAAKKE
ncbi:MAG TPA: AlpA family phage regulatory protein [Candidatus Binataceae bacterium]|jgi:prophage regulatory protein|nr:AlpA family phage regulatory protein [Candidatus Binataceae bacterium]